MNVNIDVTELELVEGVNAIFFVCANAKNIQKIVNAVVNKLFDGI